MPYQSPPKTIQKSTFKIILFTKRKKRIKGNYTYFVPEALHTQQGFFYLTVYTAWRKDNRKRQMTKRKCHMTDEEIFKAANSRPGWYRRCGLNVVYFLLSPKIFAIKKKRIGQGRSIP